MSSTPAIAMKLEIVAIPVSVDRAKRFCGDLGWRLDADFARLHLTFVRNLCTVRLLRA